MGRKSKRFREMAKACDVTKSYTVAEAVDILKRCPPVKFDQSLEIGVVMGVDPKKSDQQVRGTVALPNGTGKSLKIVVIAKGDKADEAKTIGADYVGSDELIEKIASGWTDFDALVTTPDMMREVGKLGKVLGPRGLMPTPKAGTVTTDIVNAVKDLKSGKIEFKVDRHGVINRAIGKLSFEVGKLVENAQAFLQAVIRAKPPGAKGQYIKSISLSSTMGPGMKIDLKEVEAGTTA